MSVEDADFENVPAETPLSPEQAIIRRHRREKKELQGKIIALKKNIGKNDKKKKKELADEINRLETELEHRHKLELNALCPNMKVELCSNIINPTSDLNSKSVDSISNNLPDLSEYSTPTNSIPGTPRISKAQKRRDKKIAEEKERQKRIDQETKELEENSAWKKEDKELETLLKELNLEVFEIPADGHCLYSAISHQMDFHSLGKLSVKQLRKNTGEYLRQHKDEFINYFDESISGSNEKFLDYCKEIEDTSTWGGQIEIQILSKLLQRPIRIIQANAPTITFGEEFPKPDLTLTYHHHKIQAGEHYNSAVPLL